MSDEIKAMARAVKSSAEYVVSKNGFNGLKCEFVIEDPESEHNGKTFVFAAYNDDIVSSALRECGVINADTFEGIDSKAVQITVLDEGYGLKVKRVGTGGFKPMAPAQRSGFAQRMAALLGPQKSRSSTRDEFDNRDDDIPF